MKASYTAHKDPQIDQTIDQHMEIIVEEVRKAVVNVDSIILAGGFGRGEGTVRRSPNGKYLPMNDYDLYILSDTFVPYDVHRNLSERLIEKIGIPAEPKFIRTSRLGLLIPDMFTFDLKSASRVIWGKDLRNRILIEKNDVPLGAGLNTLFIETIALIESFEPEYLTKGIPQDKIPRLSYISSKVFVEICNAFSLLGNFYDSYIENRSKLFCVHYDSSFPQLSKLLPDLPEKVTYHTDRKLKSVDFNVEDMKERWLDARNALTYCLWYFACTVLHKPFDTNKNFPRFLYKNRRRLASFYFEPYVRYAFRRTHVPPASFLLRVATPVTHVYENYRYMRNCYKDFGRVCLAPLLQFESPLIRIYVVSAFLLDSIDETGNVDAVVLKDALHLLSSLYPCDSIDLKAPKSWSIVRDCCMQVFKTYASTPETITF